MTLLRQIGLTLVLVTCATIAAARYYPASHALLGKLGLPETVLAAVAAPENSADEAGGRGGGGLPATAVHTMPVSTGAISTTVQAVGSSEALRSVSVVPLDTGVLTQVAVASGDIVAAGDLLAQLNADTEEIVRDRAAVTLRSAQAEYTRYEGLGQSNATTQSELDTLLAARDDAALALTEAEVELQQRSVLAPIGGVVGIVPVEVGDYVTTETEIAMIDDRSQIMVDFWIPERFVGLVEIGQPVTATSMALSSNEFTGAVSAIGSRVETDSRTLQVRAMIDNADDVLRPGMAFNVTMAFEGETYLSVDPLALLWDSDGSYVWAVIDGEAIRTPAEIVQRNANTVLIDADITEGTQVITEGTLNVRAGAAVAVQNDTAMGGETDHDLVPVDGANPDAALQTSSETEG